MNIACGFAAASEGLALQSQVQTRDERSFLVDATAATSRQARSTGSKRNRADPPPEAFDALAALFRVLAEPLRLRIIRMIESRGSITVSQIAEALGASQPTVSKHLRVLEDAGIVKKQPTGATVNCSIADVQLVRLCEEICDRIQLSLQARAALVSLTRASVR